MKRISLALLLTLSLVPELKAQRADTVDAIVRDFIRRRNIPAAAIAVVRRGRVMKVAGYGLANLEFNIAATGHSAFEIGSITKQFTAEAVMMLVEEGKLTLDDPIARYLPGLPDEWREIRLRHLLTHTSGLHDWEGDSAFSFRREYTTEEFVAFLARRPLDFTPGSRFAYTNSAYPLIGKIVEQVSGVPYERFVRERIFTPAGMTETRLRDNTRLIPNRASGYVDQQGVLINGEPLRPAILVPNGGVVSTATDMARWSIALAAGTLLKPTTIALMMAPTRLGDGSLFPGGIGWFLGDVKGHRMAVHNGSTVAGYSSVVYRFPDDDVSVVVLFNIDRFDAVNALATDIAARYLRLKRSGVSR